jgi:alkylhydroperoxidase family enzyme
VCSEAGVSDEKILALADYNTSKLFDQRERLALEYADAMTLSDRDVSDGLFERIAAQFDPEAVIELTAVIAWENASSKFNRALRIGSQGLWRRDRGA